MKILLALFISLFVGFQSSQEETVNIYRVEIENGFEIYGKNTNYFPVTVELDFDLSNMTSSKGDPIVTTIDGKSEIKLTDLKVKKENESWGMSYRSTFYQGSIFVKHDDNYAYRLPYRKGEIQRLDQGYNGSFSHKGEGKYALDFNLKEGTEVYAARQGIVVETEDSYSEGGDDRSLIDKANYVSILHDDGTFAQYSHLKKSGVTVKKGQKVRAGERIGLSGETGFVTGPHLHFTVLKTKKGGGFVSIPVKFATKDGIQELKEGEVYLGY